MFLKISGLATLLASAALAVDSLDFGAGVGYRHDNMHWAMYDNQGFNALDLKYQNLQSLEIEAFAKGTCKRVYLQARGDYSRILSGTNQTGFLFDPNLNPNQIPLLGIGGTFRFTIPLQGWLADVEAEAGIAIPLWENRSRHVFLIPLAGACSHWQHVRYQTPEAISSLVTQIPASIPFSSALLTPEFTHFSSAWWGSEVGLNLDVCPIDSFEFELEYKHLFLAHTQQQMISGIILLDFAGTPVPEMFVLDTKSKFRYLQGNQVRGKIGYLVSPFWKLGLSGSVLHVKTPTKRRMDIAETIQIPSLGFQTAFTNFLRTKASWTMYDILIESGFAF